MDEVYDVIVLGTGLKVSQVDDDFLILRSSHYAGAAAAAAPLCHRLDAFVRLLVISSSELPFMPFSAFTSLTLPEDFSVNVVSLTF